MATVRRKITESDHWSVGHTKKFFFFNKFRRYGIWYTSHMCYSWNLFGNFGAWH